MLLALADQKLEIDLRMWAHVNEERNMFAALMGV